MANAVVLIAAILFPSLLAYAVLGAAKLWRRWQARDTAPVPIGQPIERIAADVRRLYGQRSDLASQRPGPGRGSRTRALDAAYLDALAAACRALEVTPPEPAGGRPDREIERVESELRLHGLDVRRRTVH